MAMSGEVCGFWLSLTQSDQTSHQFEVHFPKRIVRVWRRQLLGDLSQHVNSVGSTQTYTLPSSCHDNLMELVKAEEEQGAVLMQPLRFVSDVREADSREIQISILRQNLRRAEKWRDNVSSKMQSKWFVVELFSQVNACWLGLSVESRTAIEELEHALIKRVLLKPKQPRGLLYLCIIEVGGVYYVRYCDYLSYAGNCKGFLSEFQQLHPCSYCDLILSEDDMNTLRQSEHIAGRATAKSDLSKIQSLYERVINLLAARLISLAVLVDASKKGDLSLQLALRHGTGDIGSLSSSMNHQVHVFQAILSPVPMDTELDYIPNCLPNLRMAGYKANKHTSLYLNWRLQSAKRRYLVSAGLSEVEEIFERAINRLEIRQIEPVVQRYKRRISDLVVTTNDMRQPVFDDSLPIPDDCFVDDPMASVGAFLANFRSDLMRFGRCILMDDHRGEVDVLWNASDSEDCRILRNQFVTTTFSRESKYHDNCDGCAVFKSSFVNDKVRWLISSKRSRILMHRIVFRNNRRKEERLHVLTWPFVMMSCLRSGARIKLV